MLIELTAVKRRAFRKCDRVEVSALPRRPTPELFGTVMSKVHGDNFVPATSHHSRGDLKCDGLLKKPLTIYACYGPTNGGAHLTPQSMKAAVAKVADDCNGAIKNWPDIEHWIFVTNFVDGIPPQITQEILRIQRLAPRPALNQFGLEQFETHILGLSHHHIEDLVGDATTEEDFRSMQIPVVQSVINDIITTVSASTTRDDLPIVVPAQKLDFNQLPEVYRTRLNQGFQNSGRVSKYLHDHQDPTLDGAIAGVFKTKYIELKSQGLKPWQIMDCLYDFALAGQGSTTPREVAVWSLLAYLFEECTIFEDDPTKVPA